ncbi:MAG: NAD(P)H-dependent oxidoreductase [bacterium]
MSRIVVIYYSRSGNTKKMAELVAEGVKEESISVDLQKVEEFDVESLPEYEGIIIGSPTYYGSMAAPLKQLFDDSIRFQGDLEGKIGGAFSTSANVGGGNESTVMGILKAMLAHGMIIQGCPLGDHYGPIAVGAPDERSGPQCKQLGRKIALLVKLLHGDK